MKAEEREIRRNRKLTGHNGAYRFILLFSFQLSFFLWTTLSLFLMFLFAFIFLSLIAHVCISVIENECSALRFLLFKQGTPRPVTRQSRQLRDVAERPLHALSRSVKHFGPVRQDILTVVNPCVAMPRDILTRHRECGPASSDRRMRIHLKANARTATW